MGVILERTISNKLALPTKQRSAYPGQSSCLDRKRLGYYFSEESYRILISRGKCRTSKIQHI